MRHSLNKLPDLLDSQAISKLSPDISMQTVFNTKAKDADENVLQYLLRKLRIVIKNRPLVKTGQRHRSEESFRKEVHDEPDKFRFDNEMLLEYNAYHLSEMILVIIEKLKEKGIDARVTTGNETFDLPVTPFNRDLVQ